LEIKCPLSRKLVEDGPIVIVDGQMIYENGEVLPFIDKSIKPICPVYYWVQMQLQLECCNLEECDFWQCEIREYESREDFIEDTDQNEPFRSKKFGFEKGCLIQLLPKKTNLSYWSNVHENATFLYPPKIEMSQEDCDKWIAETLSNYRDMNFKFDKIIYWRLEQSKNVVVKRNREWFSRALPRFRKMWNYVLFLRQNPEKMKLFLDYVDSRSMKRNKEIMNVIEKLYSTNNIVYINLLKNNIDKGFQNFR